MIRPFRFTSNDIARLDDRQLADIGLGAGEGVHPSQLRPLAARRTRATGVFSGLIGPMLQRRSMIAAIALLISLGFTPLAATGSDAVGSWFCKHGELGYGTLGIARDYYIVVRAGRGSYAQSDAEIVIADGPLKELGAMLGVLYEGEHRTIVFATSNGTSLLCTEVL